jgi:hypothetical protein
MVSARQAEPGLGVEMGAADSSATGSPRRDVTAAGGTHEGGVPPPPRDNELRRRLRDIDVDGTTPRQALELLAALKMLAEES